MPTVLPCNRPGPVARERLSSVGSPPPSGTRLLSIPRRSSGVSRCLFGAPDPKETIEFAREAMKKEQDRLSAKYNFDFETGTPLEGNFVYEPIEDVPECLRDQSASFPMTPIKKRPHHEEKQRKITEFMHVTKPSQVVRKRRSQVDDVPSCVPVVKSPRYEEAAV